MTSTRAAQCSGLWTSFFRGRGNSVKKIGSILIVFLGGALGGLARYGLNQWVGDPTSLLGTTIENLTGSFLLALLTAYAVDSDWPEALVLGLGTGVIGGYTTFSTLMLATMTNIRQTPGRTLGLFLVNLLGGLVLAGLGYYLGDRATERREGEQ